MKPAISISRNQIVCILCGVLLYGAAQLAQSGDSVLREGKYLKRNSYGQGDLEYEVLVEGLAEGREMAVPIRLKERIYTQEEADQVFDQVYEVLCQTILGENKSLSEIRTDLNLVTKVSDYGIKISWESEEPELIDSYGKVNNKDLEANRTVYLSAEMSAGEAKAIYEIPLVICPLEISGEEKQMNEFQNLIGILDGRDQTQEELRLPDKYMGKELAYRVEDGSSNKLLLLLGIGGAMLLPLKEKSDQERKRKERQNQMLLDYSEILSKLTVFLGAGITARKAWERIVKDYEAAVAGKRKKRRFAYEEMCRAYYQMDTGIGEGQAYCEFGDRCQLASYRKLAALLEQNLKTGTKGLRNLLEIEMAGAFEQRKAVAKRLGEEAGTKLLMPLFLMLAIVMVMIVVPALMSFQM